MENEFGENLKRILEERGVTQKWLAQTAETQEATISRYCTGTNKSSRLDILVNIARALNVTTDYLLGVSEFPNFKQYITPIEKILVDAYRAADERDKNIIWSVLEQYASAADMEKVKSAETQREIS